MKKVIIFIIAVCLLFAGYKFVDKIKSQNKDVKLYGNIDIRQVNLAFQVSGQLIKLNVEEGYRVKAGDLLAEIDDEPYKIKYNQAVARKEQAQASFNTVNSLFKRNRKLCVKKLLSKQECDKLANDNKQAEANLKLATTMVSEAKLHLKHTKLYALEEGVILTRIYEKGSILSAGMPVFSQLLSKNTWIRTYIDEINLGRVKLGSKVQISIDADNRTYEGHIGFISPLAEFTPKNIETESLRPDLVYKVRIIVDNADEYLKQGMPVSIKVLN